jgi:hypothetical protein
MTEDRGTRALHDIWGLSGPAQGADRPNGNEVVGAEPRDEPRRGNYANRARKVALRRGKDRL